MVIGIGLIGSLPLMHRLGVFGYSCSDLSHFSFLVDLSSFNLLYP
jgi:hypothetical protein